MEGGQAEGGETELLLSSERLSSDSPVMWPDQQHFCKHRLPMFLSHHSFSPSSWRLQSFGEGILTPPPLNSFPLSISLQLHLIGSSMSPEMTWLPSMVSYGYLHLHCLPVAVETELASLTPAQLMEKIRGLQNLAYQLGVEEGKSHDLPLLLECLL